jgi:hypothetical protein
MLHAIAPHAGAWIETDEVRLVLLCTGSADRFLWHTPGNAYSLFTSNEAETHPLLIAWRTPCTER